ncbi:hypothetical protein [Flavobacterium sp. MMS24-S5]|uniref:hypothetical protein n=1 Tax=Flavobacterium sp. MMS24-S5 TaxID=3416605 RepID=UPI003D08E7F8
MILITIFEIMKDQYQYIKDEEELKLNQRLDKNNRRQNRIIFILFIALIIILAAMLCVTLLTSGIIFLDPKI